MCYHWFYLKNYTANVGKTNISSVTRLWHNNFGFNQGRNHKYVLKLRERDNMAMTLFQQLLWNPEIIWSSNHGTSFTLNKEVQAYTNIVGKEYPNQVLKYKMNQLFRKKN